MLCNQTDLSGGCAALRRATQDPRETEGEALDSGFQRSTRATSRAQVPEPGTPAG